MNDLQEQVAALEQQLHALRASQQQLQEQIDKAGQQVFFLKKQLGHTGIPVHQVAMPLPDAQPVPSSPVLHEPRQSVAAPVTSVWRSAEDFIGTNLISKIGILITIIGIFIGAKYAIDNELISPAMRMLSGYICAGLLAGIGIRLKAKYLQFSAVLVGGGIAVAYFITYSAYSFYNLLPQTAAFLLMLVTTVAAVLLALWYNQKIIALLGQVAAYAIPLLLSDGSGKVAVLFTYISIINVGVLVLSFKKDWKVLYRLAFIITWLMYVVWLIDKGDIKQLSYVAVMTFLTLHFFTFYLTFLAYKIYRKELYQLGEILVLLVNALVYFLVGFYVADLYFTGVNALTVFTVCNACIHFVVGYAIYRAKLADRSVELFVAGLGLLFISVAIPVKLDGSWVTLLWSLEALILVIVATRSGRWLYFEIALPVIAMAVLSLFQDWATASYTNSTPFFNETFLVSLITSFCLGYSARIAPAGIRVLRQSSLLEYTYRVWVGFLFTGILFLSVYMELYHWLPANKARIAWLILYTLLYVTAALEINNSFIRSGLLTQVFRVSCLLAIAIMLTEGLYVLGAIHVAWIRYACLSGIALAWIAIFRSRRQFPYDALSTVVFSAAFNITILTCICKEYLYWLDQAGYRNHDRLGLSLIGGSYALVVLFIGLIRDQKHLRIGAISLFGVIIIKLFAYDLASLNTISKTVVMIVLGALLLVASFLYNKYKAVLAEKAAENEQNEQA